MGCWCWRSRWGDVCGTGVVCGVCGRRGRVSVTVCMVLGALYQSVRSTIVHMQDNNILGYILTCLQLCTAKGIPSLAQGMIELPPPQVLLNALCVPGCFVCV